jgi:methylated-DNA-protein-cysteine methyltransferase-like protein
VESTRLGRRPWELERNRRPRARRPRRRPQGLSARERSRNGRGPGRSAPGEGNSPTAVRKPFRCPGTLRTRQAGAQGGGGAPSTQLGSERAPGLNRTRLRPAGAAVPRRSVSLSAGKPLLARRRSTISGTMPEVQPAARPAPARPRRTPPRSAARAPTLSRLRSVIARIPRGRVITYGQVASAAGFPGAARLTVWALQGGTGLPWHRVVGAGGRIALPGDAGEEQRLRLTLEGITFRGRRVRMERHGWTPPPRTRPRGRRALPPAARRTPRPVVRTYEAM